MRALLSRNQPSEFAVDVMKTNDMFEYQISNELRGAKDMLGLLESNRIVRHVDCGL